MKADDQARKQAHRRTEQAVSEGESTYRTLFDSSTDGIFILGLDGNFIDANRTAYERLGYTREEFLALNISKLDYPGFAARVPDRFKQIRERGVAVFESGHLRKDGSVMPVEVNSRLLEYKGRQVFFSVIRDITERKKAEEALGNSEKRYRALFDQSPNGIVLIDTTGRIIEFNDAAHRQLGYTREEFARLSISDLDPFENPRNVEARIRRIMQEGKADFYVRHRTKQGELRDVHVIIQAIMLSGSPVLHGIWHDITEIKSMRDRLEEKTAEQNAILENALVGIALLKDRRFDWINSKMEQMFGYELSEVKGLTTEVFYPSQESYEQLGREAYPLLARGGTYSSERLMKRKDGSVFWCSLSGKAIEAAAPVRGSIWILQDITERKQAEAALQKSEKMLQTIIEAEPECVKLLDENAGLIMMNRAGLDMIQVDFLEQVRGQCVCPMITSEYRTAFLDLTRRVFQGETGTLLFKMVGMKGRHLWLETHAVPLRNEKNEITALLGVTRDVTRHKRAEEELREKEEKYRLLFESANDGIFILDETGFADCNEKGAEMYGLTKVQVIGRSPEEFAPERQPDGRLSSEVAAEKIRAALSGIPQIFEWQSVRADCSPFDVELTLNRLELAGRMCLQAIVRDIGERKRAEEERRRLQAQLFQSQKMESVGRLAGGVAHDFNNMLTAILGYTEMAMMECGPSEGLHSYLKVIEQSALRSADLVQQLLAFARRQTIAPRVLDLNDTVEGLLRMLRRLLGEDIDFGWMPGTGLWPVRIDASQVDQLLTNLCVNARDAISGVGKITIETANVVFDEAYCRIHSGYVLGEYAMLAISDNGCGMSKELVDHIFEPFFTTKEAGMGTGLGLATVYGIVKQNEGFINVYSEPGKGSTFKVYLPRCAGQITEPMAADAQETPKGSGETVLLVEDEASILAMGRDMLEALGYRVLTADTPGEAIRQGKAHFGEIQLLITDVVMPEMNGRDLEKLLRGICPGLKCLFMSAYTANVITHRGILDKGVHFLQKPFSAKSLAIKVREALEGT